MGACSSCLGGQNGDAYDEEDETQALFDPHGMQYDTFEQQNMNGYEDPEETQRELEALQRVVARTYSNMVNIYEITPPDQIQPANLAYTAPAQAAKVAQYQRLLRKLGCLANDESAATAVACVDWDGLEEEYDGDDGEGGDDEAVIELPLRQQQKEGDKEGAGIGLVGDFADAAAAMA